MSVINRGINGLAKTYGGLPREIYILFVARIINRFGGFVHAFLTFFLTLKVGLTPIQAGGFMAASGIAHFVGTFVGGYLGDHFGRKRSYVIAQSIAAFLFVPCGFLGHSIIVAYLLIVSSFFSAIVQPINTALVADLVSKEDRKRAFSLLYYGINIGVAVGPLVAGFLFYNYLPWIFWGDAITTFIAVILIVKYIKETKLSEEEIDLINDTLDEHEKKETGDLLMAFLRRPVLVVYTLFSMLASFVYSQQGYGIPLHLGEMFGEQTGTQLYGQLMSFNAVVVLVFTIITMKLGEKYKAIYNIAFANFLYAIGFGLMIFVNGYLLLYISVFIWTIGEILAVTNSGVFVMNHTPISHRSRFSAIINIIRSIGYTFGPPISGWIIANSGIKGLWIVTAILGMLGFAGMIIVGEIDKKQVTIRHEENRIKSSQAS